MNTEILSLRDAARHPKKYAQQFFRHPRKYLQNLVKYPRRAIFGPKKKKDPKVSAELAKIGKDILTWWPWRRAQVVAATMPSGRPWPRISIVTPSFNQGAYIEQTIRSVLLQGYPNLQYIVVDGGSTDNTQVILKRYAREIDVCISESDDGQASAINKGFQYADGEILAWLNSDDMHLPDTLTSVAVAFERTASSEKRPDMVCGQTLLRSEDSDTVTWVHKSKFGEGIHPLPKDINDFNDVWQKQPGFFYQPEVFFTRAIWTKIGSALNSRLHYALDFDLWIRMSKHDVFLYSLARPLAIFRLHAAQKTKFLNDTQYPEHQAVSTFHRADPSPDAQYVPAQFQANIHETIPADIFRHAPLSYHETAIGNYYVPCLAENDVIARSMRVGRIFEPQIVETARAYIKPGSVVLDIGANFGQMSVLFSELTGRDGMVFSFEVQEYCFAILLKNIQANHKENIRAFYAAVFDRTLSEVAFPEPSFLKFPSYGSFPISLNQTSKSDKRVKTLAIDDLKIERPISFLKIDTQGSDLYVLRGARETIAKHRIPVLFEYEEQFQDDLGTKFEDYIEFVHSIGYKIDKVVDGINYLIIPDEKLSKTPPVEATVPASRKDLIEVEEPPFRKQLNKFLKNEAEVAECTEFLHRYGYVSHNLKCKDWDLALIIPEIGDGNVLDMGSSDSYILKNVCLKRTNGKKYGIDYNDPDVPLSEVTYMKGSLLETPLPDGHLQYITCLSVIEHQVDFRLFAKEVNRLLVPGGKLFVTYDYWEPRLKIPVKAYGLDWQPLDRALTESLIAECKKEGLQLNQDVDWSTEEAVIRWGYYSPHPEISYTFGLLVFEKR